MVRFPLEVVEEILCRLPVKPLKRFRCVAKSWRSLIDNEKFVKLHLKRSLETKSHRHVIVRDGNGIFDLALDNADPVKSKVTAIKPPFSSSVTDILNSCNGLFVISGEPIIMWNPFTTEYKTLPKIVDDDFPVPFGCSSKIVCGFVWDSRVDDYKVVRVVEHSDNVHDNWIDSRAHIYELKSNSWRQTVEFTYPVFDWMAVVNGALHTIVYNLGLKIQPVQIMAFSVERERHYEVKLPHLGNIWEADGLSLAVHNLDGCLSLMCTIESGISIRVMKDYGVTGSWTKLLSVPMKVTVDELGKKVLKPLVYSKDGHKVLLSFGVIIFVWHDLRNQTNAPVNGLPNTLNFTEACVESLVTFPNEQVQIQVHDQDKEKDRKKIRKKSDKFLSKGFKLVL